jgi:uncharacterized protein (UPF0548 family)
MRPAVQNLPLTFDATTATVTTDFPASAPSGYRVFERAVPIGDGDARWQFARRAALSWGIKTRSGFEVRRPAGGDAPVGTNDPVTVGESVWLIAHIGPLRVREPVRVVAVVDEESRQGFAYATLRGHPVRGEEAFLVERRDDGSVWLTIRSISRAARGLWWPLSPALAVAQRVYRGRYFRALAGPLPDAQTTTAERERE